MSTTASNNYGLTETELETIFYGFRNKNILLTAKPGSGKGTVCKNMIELFSNFCKKRNIDPETGMWQHFSSGEYFRKEVANKTEIGATLETYMKAGTIVPEDIANGLVAKELSKGIYRNGTITEGFPKTVSKTFSFYFDLLEKLQIEPLLVINLDVSREIVVERLTGRLNCPNVDCGHDFHKKHNPPKKEGICDFCGTELKSRSDDNEEAINKRQQVYEELTMPTLDKYKEMGILTKVDASKTIDEVTTAVLRAILKKMQSVYDSTFFPRPALEKDRSATFHGHIDAKNVNILSDIIFRVEKQDNDFQHKCYPIHCLQLGAQTKDATYKEVYQCLPNFHEIATTQHFEAFATSRHGADGFNYDLLSSTLEETFKHPNDGVMTELEEELFVGNFENHKPDGKIIAETDRMAPEKRMKEFLWSKVRNGEDWKKKMISHVPTWELHHAVDIPKKPEDKDEDMPLKLADLHNFCEQNGFQCGGWFVFRKLDRWAFRSNEFSDLPTLEEAQGRLIAQGRALNAWVAEQQKKDGSKFTDRGYTTGFSIERVWAIWKIY